MRKFLLVLLCCSIMLNCMMIQPYAAYSYKYMANRTHDRVSVSSLAGAIYTRLDGSMLDDVLRSGKKAYEEGKYEESLKLYRNYFIEKMRKANAGYYPYYTPNSKSLMLLADVVCGKKTLDDYYAAFPSETWVDDCLGAYGSPYEEREINWLGGMDKAKGTGYWGKGQEAFLSWIGMMGAAYYKSGGDVIYLDKFFEVTSDFSLNHYNDIMEYEKSTPNIPIRERDSRTWQWPGLHGNNERTGFLTGALIQFCKLLPAEGETEMPKLSTWDDIVKPFGKANPEFYDIIDPVKLAQLTVCMVEEIINMLSGCYQADIASNQRNSGARCCVRLLAMFSEFNHLSEISQSCSDYMASPRFFYKDGTFLEQSLNYNDDEANGNKSAIDFYTSVNEKEQAWFSTIKNYNDMYYKFREAFLSNALLLPKIGNGGDNLGLREIWNSDSLLNSYKNSLGYKNDVNPPGYKSIYFPWGGYATLRSGWDIKNDMTLQTYNSETSGTGHTSLIRNGLWLTAYGRPLIVSGEGALYGESYLPEQQREEYSKWQEYFSETATRKGSTVMVNDDNQAIAPIGEAARITTENAPIIDARYHDSGSFDYIEGKYVNGYIDGETSVQYDSVTHTRQNFYIEDAKIWIVNDIMENTDSENTAQYSQIWRFPTYSKELGYYGFNNDEVVLDASHNSVKTQDKNSVNLFMSYFSNENLNYKKYYGSKGEEDGDGIYRGWTANGIQGLRVPSPDVYVRWRDDKDNLITSVMTFLAPSKTEAVPYDSLISLNNPQTNTTGFQTVTDDLTVTSLFCENKGILETDGVRAKAKNLVLTKKNGVIKGIVLDCSELYYNDLPINISSTDFEFIAEDGNLSIINAVKTPSDFAWEKSGEKDFAVYGVQDKEMLMKINSSNLSRIKSWLEENKEHFSLYRGRKIEFSNQSDYISNEIFKKLPVTRVTEISEIIYEADKKWLETVLPINVKNIIPQKNIISFDVEVFKKWQIKEPVIYVASYKEGGMLNSLIKTKLSDDLMNDGKVSITNSLIDADNGCIKVFIWENESLLPLSK